MAKEEGAVFAAKDVCETTRATHSNALSYPPLVEDSGFVSTKSQTIGKANRENVPSTFSPLLCQRQTVLF